MSIIWSDLAIEDLNDIEDYIARDNPARAGEDSYGKSEAIMIPPKGTGPLLKQRL